MNYFVSTRQQSALKISGLLHIHIDVIDWCKEISFRFKDGFVLPTIPRKAVNVRVISFLVVRFSHRRHPNGIYFFAANKILAHNLI